MIAITPTRPLAALALGVISLVLSPSRDALAQTTASPAPAADATTVMLPLPAYERLLDRAAAATRRPDGAPLATAALAAVLDVRVADTGVQGRLTLTGSALRTGDHQVPLVAGVPIVDVRLAGQPAMLTTDEKGGVAAIVHGSGPFTISADWTADLGVVPGRTSLTLPVTRAGTTRLTLTVPGDAADLKLTGGVVTARRRTGPDTTIEATLASGSAAQVSWRSRDTPADDAPVATGPARVVSDVSTVVTLGESDLRVTALVTLTVSRGRLDRCTLDLPAGFRLVSVTGRDVDVVQPGAGIATVTFTTADATTRRLLVSLDRPLSDRSYSVPAGTIGVRDAGRERGDLAVEGAGMLALTATPGDTLRAIDARELPPTVRALVQWPVLGAWRYQRTGGEPAPAVALRVDRFAKADVAPAVTDHASATTLLTTDGRALTEVRAAIVNERQPFVKVTLPAGARIVSAALDGTPVKPVSGPDGLRLPLVAGSGGGPASELVFVYLEDAGPFSRKGERTLTLPGLDLPVSVCAWEVFTPDSLRVRRVGGTALEAGLFVATRGPDVPYGFAVDQRHAGRTRVRLSAATGADGTVRGRAIDDQRAPLPGVDVMVRVGAFERHAVTGADGGFAINGVPPGQVTVVAALVGFVPASATFAYERRPVHVELALAVGALQETITVSATAPEDADDEPVRDTPPPPHVLDLQQRVAGVLPLRVEVPRAGRSQAFVAPLVVGDAPTLTVRYRRR